MEQKRFSISVSAEMHAWLKVQAANNHRSLAGEVNTILEKMRDSREEPKKHEQEKEPK